MTHKMVMVHIRHLDNQHEDVQAYYEEYSHEIGWVLPFDGLPLKHYVCGVMNIDSEAYLKAQLQFDLVVTPVPALPDVSITEYGFIKIRIFDAAVWDRWRKVREKFKYVFVTQDDKHRRIYIVHKDDVARAKKMLGDLLEGFVD